MTELEQNLSFSRNNGASTGADAAAAPTPSLLRPLWARVLVGAIAIVGLSAIGAFSMLAGLDGAHASPPASSSVWLAASASANVVPLESPVPHSARAAPAAPQTTLEAQAATPVAAPCPSLTADGKVILNRASTEDLRKIPGIGPKRAEAILQLRTKLKRFRKPSDLLRVKGIGAKSLLRMQSHFVLDAADGSACDALVTFRQ